MISLTESLSLTTRSAHSTRLNAGGYNTPTQLPLILYTLHATRQLPMSLSSTTSRHRCLTGVFTAAAAIEAFADEPLGSIAPASEVRDYKSDRIALCIKILILGRHRVSPTPLLHPRRPWKSCTTTWTNAFFTKSSLKTYQHATTGMKNEKCAYSLVCVTKSKHSSRVLWHFTQKPSRAFSCSASLAVRAVQFADATNDVPIISRLFHCQFSLRKSGR